ncbi:MFS transporter [Actinomycetota bacterium]
MREFRRVLVNTGLANITTSYLWFALTFWVYLETRSVLATSIIGGGYMLLLAVCGLAFGVIVDRHHKKAVMVASAMVTLAAYLLAGAVYLVFDRRSLLDWGGPAFWLFAGTILIGGVVESLRNIALSTTVTLLVPDDQRDRANGQVGTVMGLSFLVTSVFSGLSIGHLGMGWTLVLAIVLTALALVDLLFVSIPEDSLAHDPALAGKVIDVSGAMRVIRAVPGLLALVLFTTFNNLIGGVFIALMDPYGLTLFSVSMWGIVLGVTSLGFILGGTVVARRGLGARPLRTLMLANLAVALLGLGFAAREWAWLYALGIFLFMCVSPVAEAAEQTLLQRVVPYSHQGRVFGFAQSLEAAASPVTAFVIGPIAQFGIIPWMRSQEGRDALGWLVGAGEARGMAVVFMGASLVMLVATVLAMLSRPYRLLGDAYAAAPPPTRPVGEPT